MLGGMDSSQYLTGISIDLVPVRSRDQSPERRTPHAVPRATAHDDKPRSLCGVDLDEVHNQPFPPGQSLAFMVPACRRCKALAAA